MESINPDDFSQDYSGAIPRWLLDFVNEEPIAGMIIAHLKDNPGSAIDSLERLTRKSRSGVEQKLDLIDSKVMLRKASFGNETIYFYQSPI